jgi:hypothetical protein
VSALGDELALARALRPLKRKTGSRHDTILDEGATADRIAENLISLSDPTGPVPVVPVMRPAPERWLEVAIVVDGHESMLIWRQLANDLRALMERMGAFRDVRSWVLGHAPDDPSRLGVSRRPGSMLRSAKELTDPSGRRLILVLSDCLGPSWQSGTVQRQLGEWGRTQPVAILQPLPHRLWDHTFVHPFPTRLQTVRAGAANAQLSCARPASMGRGVSTAAPVPVLELAPDWLASWTRLISAAGMSGVPSMVAYPHIPGFPQDAYTARQRHVLTPQERVRRFHTVASPEAFRLAVHLAAAPVTLPVIRLIQRALVRPASPSQLAEVFLGGLLSRRDEPGNPDPDQVQYNFQPGVREALLGHLRRTEALRVLLAVSDFVDVRFGQARDFRAFLAGVDMRGDQPLSQDSVPFALTAERVLRMLGGRYAITADRLALSHADPAALESPPREAPHPTAGIAEALAGVKLPERRSRAKPLACPYCYHAFAESQIMFRCVGQRPARRNACEPQRDTKLEELTGQSQLLPPVFPGRGRREEADCPRCHTPTRHPVCPGCHSELPANFRAAQGRLIALVGPYNSGKTAFMTVLLHELRHAVGERLNSSTVSADETTYERFFREYELPMYTHSALPQQTVTAAGENIRPLVFRFTQDHRGRFRQRRTEFLLSFVDGAGGDLTSEFKVEHVARYLAAADGVIALVDPLQVAWVRERLGSLAGLPPGNAPEQRPVAAFERMTELLLRGSPARMIDKPVAIVVTKMDALAGLPARDGGTLATPSGTAYTDADDADILHEDVCRMLGRWGASRINDTAELYYKRHRYFALSSLGSPPTPDNQVSAGGIRPDRIADPFAWLLRQFSFASPR